MKVRRFFLRLLPRLGIFVLSVLLLSVLTFYISRLAPGDPLVSYYGDRVEKMSPAEREWAEDKLGLNDPLPTQYARWFSRALHGDFGISYKYKIDVLELIGDRIGNTLLLGGLGFVLLFVLALLLGALCAWKEDRPLDRILCKLGTVTSCIPEFWLSLMLILLFSVTLRWLPSSGAYSVGHADDVGDRIVHLILPMSVVVLSHLWYYTYLVRNRLVEELRQEVRRKHLKTGADALEALKGIIREMLRADGEMQLSGRPAVVLVIGVNGVGKTTSIAKLAHLYKQQGKRVMLAAGDTFRAAAAEQLCVWAERADVPVVKHNEGADPAAVLFDAVQSAAARGYDMVICDTAGRLHNKKNLMDELSKISRVVHKACGTASVETLLVLDAITGQNAISQASQFIDAAGATGIVLTKLDGTAKGGAVISIKAKLGLPVRFVGVGEGMDDLMEFDPDAFVDALFLREE